MPACSTPAWVRVLPIDAEIGDSCITIEGHTPPSTACPPADWQAASDGYFEAMRIRIVEGRGIEATDRVETAQVIVVNEAFVEQYFAEGDRIGRRVRFAFQQNVPFQTVVGVVADVRHNGLTGPVKPAFFRPHAQWPVSTGGPQRAMTVVIRSARDAQALEGPVRAIVRELDPRLPVSRVQTLETVMSGALAQPRFTMMLLLVFGGLALAPAVLGIYGVISYAVAMRRHEPLTALRHD